MKKVFLFTPLMTIALFVALIITGCKKESSETLSPVEEEEAARISSEARAETELVSNDVFDNVMGVNDEVGMEGTGVFGGRTTGGDLLVNRGMDLDSIQCFTVTVTKLNPPAHFPVKIEIDFGNGCVGADGHLRSGKIITVYTGRLIHAGAIATTTFENYKIDSISVEGTHKITNTTNSTPGSNQLQFTVDIVDGKLSKPNGNYIKWNSNRVKTRIEGNGTPFVPFDDVFSIEGHAIGHVKRGNVIVAWKSEITQPLIKKFNCPWIVKGVIRTRRAALGTNSVWVASLNFGNGNCDYLATLTINGVVHNIQLPH